MLDTTLINPLICKQVTTEKQNKTSTSKDGTYSSAGLFRGNKLDSKARELLSQALPANFNPGVALNAGDCFFDSLAQSLNSRDKGPYTAKDLRKRCHGYVVKLDEKGKAHDNWIYQHFLADADEAAVENYHHYMASIQYTAVEIEAG